LKFIKTLVLGVFLGCMLGLWLGINIGQGEALFSNPLPAKEEAEGA